MDDFDISVRHVLALEGGYVNDPNDPGRATKFGISQRSYPDLKIKTLTEQQAIDLYRSDYWKPLNCGDMKPALAIVVFDAGVNQGIGAAAQMLQVAVGVRMDGAIGPVTLKASNDCHLPDLLVDFMAARAVRYGMYARFARGWMRRLFLVYRRALEIEKVQ